MSRNLDDIILQFADKEMKTDATHLEQPDNPEKSKMKEFFFGELKNHNGRCPLCFHETYISLSVFICPVHGELK